MRTHHITASGRSGRLRGPILLVVTFIALALMLVACDGTAVTVVRRITTPRFGPVSGLPAIAYRDLPREGRETIRLIDRGGPFPYEQDGQIFENREGILPDRPNGYYREYTVETPGSSDRGARRIVGGGDGELYYTDDHYDSFKEMIR